MWMRILPLHPLTVLCELYVLMSCLVMNDWLELESDLIFSVLYSCISNIETLPGIRFESSLSNADICSKVNLTGIFLFFFFFSVCNSHIVSYYHRHQSLLMHMITIPLKQARPTFC